MRHNLETLELFERAFSFGDRTAIISRNYPFGYRDLLNASAVAGNAILQGNASLGGNRVGLLIPGSLDYAAIQWGVWRAGGIAVPLPLSSPQRELEYYFKDAGITTLVTSVEYKSIASQISQKFNLDLLDAREIVQGELGIMPKIELADPAMIIYTSGTTGKPKGVLSTHGIIQNQIKTLVDVWGWSKKDKILCFLPLHHVHGIINILSCALWSGAVCEMMPDFSAEVVWQKIRDENFTLLMAVPTVYAKLAEHWNNAERSERNKLSRACKKIRLFVSGSAALPVPLFDQWLEISGQHILERYGMTEIGMALSNPLKGERRPGFVGMPLPGVSVRLVKEDGRIAEENESGEIQVKSESVFQEYWNRKRETLNSFSEDGWFKTGDIAVLIDSYYKILGRSSIDIIKSGGYKISALEVENKLLEHPAIKEVAVVGIPDEIWGERVAVCIVEKPGNDITPGWLRGWAKHRMADYKVPGLLLKLNSLPRNAMGKIDKVAIIELFMHEK